MNKCFIKQAAKAMSHSDQRERDEEESIKKRQLKTNLVKY